MIKAGRGILGTSALERAVRAEESSGAPTSRLRSPGVPSTVLGGIAPAGGCGTAVLSAPNKYRSILHECCYMACLLMSVIKSQYSVHRTALDRAETTCNEQHCQRPPPLLLKWNLC